MKDLYNQTAVVTGAAVTWGANAAARSRGFARGSDAEHLRLGIDCYTIRDFDWKS